MTKPDFYDKLGDAFLEAAMLRKFVSWVRNDPAILFILFLIASNWMLWSSLRDAQSVNYHLVDKLTQATEAKEQKMALYLEARDNFTNCQESLGEMGEVTSDCYQELSSCLGAVSAVPEPEAEMLPRCFDPPLDLLEPVPI